MANGTPDLKNNPHTSREHVVIGQESVSGLDLANLYIYICKSSQIGLAELLWHSGEYRTACEE